MEDFIGMVLGQAIFLLYPAWRIYERVGLNPKMSLTVIIPHVGFIICGLFLLRGKWQIQPKGGK